jgi:hypothetical protein
MIKSRHIKLTLLAQNIAFSKDPVSFGNPELSTDDATVTETYSPQEKLLAKEILKVMSRKLFLKKYGYYTSYPMELSVKCKATQTLT